MYTTHHSCWDAKNRFGLPEEAEFSYEVVRGVIEGDSLSQPKADSSLGEGALKDDGGAGTAATGTARQENSSALARAVERAAQLKQAAEREATSSVTPQSGATPSPEGEGSGDGGGSAAGAADAQYAGLPDALVRMMREAGVTPNEVRYVIAQKGIYPANTPWAVICGNEQFMKGWLMHPQVWPKVVEMAKQIRDEVPF
jgi:hypothetical protein